MSGIAADTGEAATTVGKLEAFPLGDSFATATFKVTKADHADEFLMFDESLETAADAKKAAHLRAVYDQTRPLFVEWKKYYAERMKAKYTDSGELDNIAPKLFTSWLVRVGRNENLFFSLDEEGFEKRTEAIYRERRKHLHILNESQIDDRAEKKWPKFVAFESESEFTKSKVASASYDSTESASTGDTFVMDFISGRKIAISQPSVNARSMVYFFKKKVVIEKRYARIRKWFSSYDYDGVMVEVMNDRGMRDYSHRNYHHFERRSELKTVSGLNHKYYIVGRADAGTAIKTRMSKYWFEIQRSGTANWKKTFYSSYVYKLFGAQSIQNVQRIVSQTAHVHGMTVPFGNAEWVRAWMLGLERRPDVSAGAGEITSFDSYGAKLVAFKVPFSRTHAVQTKRVAVKKVRKDAQLWWGTDDDELYNVNGSFKRALHEFANRFSEKDASLEVKTAGDDGGESGRKLLESIDDIWLADGVAAASHRGDDPVPQNGVLDNLASVEDRKDVVSDLKLHNKDVDYHGGGLSMHESDREKKILVAKGTRVKKDIMEGEFADEDLQVSGAKVQSLLKTRYGHDSVSIMDIGDSSRYAPSPLAQPLNVQFTGMAYLDDDAAESSDNDYSYVGAHQSFTTKTTFDAKKKESLRRLLFSTSFDKTGEEDDVSPKWFIIEKDRRLKTGPDGESDYYAKNRKAFKSVVGGDIGDDDHLKVDTKALTTMAERHKAFIVTSMI
jgi:hypothetical protein